jgi:ferritin-like metal-binding protein YciE
LWNKPEPDKCLQRSRPVKGVSIVSASTEKAREIYTTGLRNQHAVEKQAIELLERQVGRLENYPELEQRMRAHIEESKEQASRLEALLGSLGTGESSLKDTMMSLFGNLAAMAHAPAPDEVIKNSFANYAFEHYEIASYKALITLAEATGHAQAMSPLRQSLAEEEAMARFIDEHLKPTTLKFLARASAGDKAGL